MSAANRRKAYNWVADAIDKSLAGDGARTNPAVLAEVERIREAMLGAGAVVDEPGVEGHVSGDGKPPAERTDINPEPYTGGGGSLL